MKPQEIISILDNVGGSLWDKFGSESYIERSNILDVVKALEEIEKKKAKRKSDREAKKIMDSRYGRNK